MDARVRFLDAGGYPQGAAAGPHDPPRSRREEHAPEEEEAAGYPGRRRDFSHGTDREATQIDLDVPARHPSGMGLGLGSGMESGLGGLAYFFFGAEVCMARRSERSGAVLCLVLVFSFGEIPPGEEREQEN